MNQCDGCRQTYTRGPWHIQSRLFDSGWHYRLGIQAFSNHGEAAANARLIEAVPDLLEALKAMVECNERSEAGERIDDEPAMELAYTAVAKAEADDCKGCGGLKGGAIAKAEETEEPTQ